MYYDKVHTAQNKRVHLYEITPIFWSSISVLWKSLGVAGLNIRALDERVPLETNPPFGLFLLFCLS